jgi:hypothetical protein
MSRITRTLLAVALAALAVPASAVAAPSLVPVGSFDQPTYVTAPPRDMTRLFVVEKQGTVRVVRDGMVLGTPFLDITSDVRSSENERGLLGLAFPPDYEVSGLFYVYLTANPDGELQVREYDRSAGDPDRADGAGRIVWSQPHPNASNHNGGMIEFGPDGLLWLAPGDGGANREQAQSTASQLGKVLRIDPRPGNGGAHTIPADNPFGNTVWATGLRNPWRFSFDRETGDLVIADVGENAYEEIDWAPRAEGLGKGANYGWPCFEGPMATSDPCSPPAYSPPVFDYAHQSSDQSIAGGYVVRDPGLPTLLGRYVYADTYDGEIRSLSLARPRALNDGPVVGLPIRNLLVSFGEDACGHVHVVSLNGTVERIQDGAIGPCVLKPLPGPPAAPPAATPPDRRAPQVTIRSARRGRLGSTLTPRVTLTCDEDCRVVVTARLVGSPLRSVRASLPAGRRMTVRLRPTRRGARRIRRSLRRHRRLTLRVSAQARDSAGNLGRAARRLRVRR